VNPLLIAVFLIIFTTIGAATVVTTIPNTYDKLFQYYAAKYGLNWLMLKRIAMIESKIGTHSSVLEGIKNPSNVEGSKSYDGKSWGIMQVTLTTAKWLDASATVEKLNNPEYSISLAAKYLDFLQKYFPTTDPRYAEWVVKSYNQGQGNTAKERAGSSTGFAHDYWAKYKKYSETIK
jgi:membrane-bound lytic murein transglycosylase MltF